MADEKPNNNSHEGRSRRIRNRRSRSRSSSSSSASDDIKTIDDRGWTPLHLCASEGNLEGLQHLLREETMDPNVGTPWTNKSIGGITPLHLAAKGGHLEVMNELLKNGANIDARTFGGFCGWTPLHVAAKANKKEAIRFLLENGAFLPEDINDVRFNPPVFYCNSLEWAYEEKRRIIEEMQYENSSSAFSSSES